MDPEARQQTATTSAKRKRDDQEDARAEGCELAFEKGNEVLQQLLEIRAELLHFYPVQRLPGEYRSLLVDIHKAWHLGGREDPAKYKESAAGGKAKEQTENQSSYDGKDTIKKPSQHGWQAIYNIRLPLKLHDQIIDHVQKYGIGAREFIVDQPPLGAGMGELHAPTLALKILWEYSHDLEARNEIFDPARRMFSFLSWFDVLRTVDRNAKVRRVSAQTRNHFLAKVKAVMGISSDQAGTNLVTYYATTVFETKLDFNGEQSRFLTGFLGTEYFLTTGAALFVVDRLGRRKLIMFGAASIRISMMLMSASLSQATKENKSLAIAATVFVFVYNTFFAIGWLGLTWLYPAEVTPIRIRAETNGFSTSTNWIFNYAVVQLAPIMIKTISWKTFFVFMCFNFAFVPIVYVCFPETNGYKLEKLDAIFAEAYEQKQNPVFTEKRYRKHGGKLIVEREAERGGEDQKGVSDDGKHDRTTSIPGSDEHEEI